MPVNTLFFPKKNKILSICQFFSLFTKNSTGNNRRPMKRKINTKFEVNTVLVYDMLNIMLAWQINRASMMN